LPGYLIPHGGVGRIGGNAFLLEEGGSTLLLDLGKDFSQYRRFFDFPFVTPSTSLSRELVRTGILPQLQDSAGQGLDAYVEFEGGRLQEEEGSRLDYVFISHPHLDHCGLIPLLKRSVEVHLGATAWLILAAMQEMRRRDRSIENRLFWGEDNEPRLDVHFFRGGQEVQAGPFCVKPIPVDHSVPGAYGFVVDTPTARVAYTGDFRRHGPASELTDRFEEELAREPVDLLVCEGTNIGLGRVGDESRVERDAIELVERAVARGGRLVVVEVRSTDIDRVRGFVRVGRELGLRVLATSRVVYLLRRLLEGGAESRLLGGLPVPGRDLDLLVRGKRLEAWEKGLEEISGIEVFGREVITRPKEPMMVIDSGRFNFFELPPPQGTLYIQSVSEHVDEEGEFEEERFLNMLALSGVLTYRLHSSGHISPLELVEFVERVRPRRLVPIHTEHPEAFKELFKGVVEVVIPQKGIPIPLKPAGG
jgi:ribonuclease J